VNIQRNGCGCMKDGKQDLERRYVKTISTKHPSYLREVGIQGSD
jgi:hypothetical protein